MTKCKDCRYGAQVYKAPGIIDCCRLGKVTEPEDGCEEGREKNG